jgi:MFS family permease
MAIFPEVSSAKMAKWIASLAGAVVAIAGVLGPVLGRIIAHYTTWRWVFWIK